MPGGLIDSRFMANLEIYSALEGTARLEEFRT